MNGMKHLNIGRAERKSTRPTFLGAPFHLVDAVEKF
jgi:hypothetical protein